MNRAFKVIQGHPYWCQQNGLLSLYVIHFAINGRRGVAYRHYNIAGLSGLISEISEDVATKMAKNCHRRQPHRHLMPRHRGTSANIRTLPFSEPRVIGLHFCR